MDTLRPDTFKRKDVEKQLRELSSFRNDVWKHSGEFENMRTLGESFLSACDVDKDIVKQEVAAVKARWDKLNNGNKLLLRLRRNLFFWYICLYGFFFQFFFNKFQIVHRNSFRKSVNFMLIDILISMIRILNIKVGKLIKIRIWFINF